MKFGIIAFLTKTIGFISPETERHVRSGLTMHITVTNEISAQIRMTNYLSNIMLYFSVTVNYWVPLNHAKHMTEIPFNLNKKFINVTFALNEIREYRKEFQVTLIVYVTYLDRIKQCEGDPSLIQTKANERQFHLRN